MATRVATTSPPRTVGSVAPDGALAPAVRRGDATAPPERAASSGAAWLPAIDGLRGVAVAAVLAFHGGLSAAPGGYLGVSVFFTLSGFLLARQVLGDDRPAGAALRRFATRRARRLVPAQLTVLAAIALLVLAGPLAPVTDSFVGDLAAAVLQSANWRFVATGDDYGALFVAPSPLLHFWSLGVEIQLYLLLPPLLLGLRRLGGRTAVLVGLGGCLVAALAAAVFVPMSSARAYYGTDVRSAEVLAGALLAVGLGSTTTVRGGRRGLLTFGSMAGLGVLFAGVRLLDVDRLRIDHGHLAVVTLATLPVLAAAALGVGPVSRVLRWRPLRLLGLVSYGLYLVHWPLFVAIGPGRTGLSGPTLFAVRVAASLVCAVALYRWVERPLRTARGRSSRGSFVALVAAVALVGLFGVSAGRRTDTPVTDIVAAEAALPSLADLAVDDSTEAVAGPDARNPLDDVDAGRAGTAPDRQSALVDDSAEPELPIQPVRVAIAGDSQAVMVFKGLDRWAGGEVLAPASTADLGCGIGRGGRVRFHTRDRRIFDDCRLWDPAFVPDLLGFQPNVVLVGTGPWDFADRQLPGDDVWRSPGDPVYDEYMLGELMAANEILGASGAPVVWLTSLPVRAGLLDAVPPRFPADGPERPAALNRLIETAATRSGAHVIDLAAFLDGCEGGAESTQLRPDGVHLSEDATDMVARWLGPQLIEIAGYRSPVEQLDTCVLPSLD